MIGQDDEVDELEEDDDEEYAFEGPSTVRLIYWDTSHKPLSAYNYSGICCTDWPQNQTQCRRRKATRR